MAATAGAFDAAGDGAAKCVAAAGSTGAPDDSNVPAPDDGEADTTTTASAAEAEDCSVSALPS